MKNEICNLIHESSIPALYHEESDVDMFYGMYVRTYIEIDVINLTQICEKFNNKYKLPCK